MQMTQTIRALALVMVFAGSTSAMADDEKAAVSPATRPTAGEITTWASPVTATKNDAGQWEGKAFYDSLEPELRKSLEKEGQVLLGEPKQEGGSYAGFIKAVALFKQPKARVYELIVEPKKQPLYLPRLEEATVLETPENGELDKFELSVMFSDFVFHTRHWFYPELSRVEWKLDSKYENDIAEQEGYWQLYALGPDLTIGAYGTKVDTGVAVPDFIQEFLARKDIPTALTAFRAYIDSNGKFRKDD